MMHRSGTAPSATGYAPPRFRLRTHLLRAVIVVLAVKLLALVAIKLIWFSDPPSPPASEVARVVLGPADPHGR
ncbi:MAG: hypothetical protein O6950_12300 [Gammaproteobacteria bacterium]|nr:hypothetical protein [Gammaproteobacteria bacterium]